MSHFLGGAPKIPSKAFTKVLSWDPKAYRKNIPATITEVRAGIKKAERKKILAQVNLLFNTVANRTGTGTSTRMVQKVYRILFRMAV
jgi:hypothetical protein